MSPDTGKSGGDSVVCALSGGPLQSMSGGRCRSSGYPVRDVGLNLKVGYVTNSSLPLRWRRLISASLTSKLRSLISPSVDSGGTLLASKTQASTPFLQPALLASQTGPSSVLILDPPWSWSPPGSRLPDSFHAPQTLLSIDRPEFSLTPRSSSEPSSAAPRAKSHLPGHQWPFS